ncbi:SurA N-terminal domain-containing protein [Oceanobacillus polygoni]|uniref:RND superfamily exporter protein n=1 Tax=Oceanobacillus polygoni TaxID=1235259 RepID=A0A9X1CKC4_9BACI|nr:SurA N-terminal domain-containing protein [Oceanobacillus polygoni]MBP2079332.1 putative RND superfamily exporter protein [Oceanobacillus polygoni]
MKKLSVLSLAFVIIIMLAACGGNDEAEENENTEGDTSEQPAQQELEFADEEKLDEETPVVVVNGEEITGSDYNPIYTQVKSTMYQYGQDVSDLDMIKDQTVSILVEQALIQQDAESEGIEVTDEEVQEELDTIKETSGEEQYATLLEQLQLSEDEFKEQLTGELVTRKYMDSEFEVEVTDEEVQEYYDQLKEQNGEMGELEEVEGQIKDVLTNEKQSEQLRARIDELKEDAEVENVL